MNETLDPTKPVQAREGRAARIVCTDRKCRSEYPIIALVEQLDGVEEVFRFTRDGRFIDNTTDAMDLVNIPEKKTVYVNMYADRREVRIHQSREEADRSAAPTREACVAITYTVGQFDE